MLTIYNDPANAKWRDINQDYSEYVFKSDWNIWNRALEKYLATRMFKLASFVPEQMRIIEVNDIRQLAPEEDKLRLGGRWNCENIFLLLLPLFHTSIDFGQNFFEFVQFEKILPILILSPVLFADANG